MSHNEGWHFFNLGRLLERADKTSRILDVKYFTLLPSVQDVGSPVDDLQWSAVLRSVSGFEMYRKRFHGITVERIVDFLILDREFPRAIRYCVEEADESLHAISGSPQGSFENSARSFVALAWTSAGTLRPRPRQARHAPYGLLKLKVRGSSGGKLVPQSGQQ